MFDDLRISEFSIPVGIFVLMLLLFPAAHGSFIATHGPVTALRSLRAATAILLALSTFFVLLTLHFTAMRRAAAVVRTRRSAPSDSPAREHTCSLLC